MKRAFTMLVVIGVTALVTFLWVTRNQAQERASLLDKRLAEAEGRIGMLEGDIDTANQRLAYLTEHQRPQTIPVSRQVRNSTPSSVGTSQEPQATINLTTTTSNTRETTAQPFPVPVPFGAGGGIAGYQFKAMSGSFVRIEGTSSIHDWTVESPFIGGNGAVSPGLTVSGDDQSISQITNASATAFVLVNSLKSVEKNGKPFSDKMDQAMYELLRGEAYPRIVFTLESLKPKGNSKAGSSVQFFDARGTLAIAGVTNSIKLPVTKSPLTEGGIQFAGNTRLKMSDFNITPPSYPVGVTSIKVGDEVKVTFVWNVRPGTPLQAMTGP